MDCQPRDFLKFFVKASCCKLLIITFFNKQPVYKQLAVET